MDAEHHRDEEQAGQDGGAERIAVEVDEEPGHAVVELHAEGHDQDEGDGPMISKVMPEVRIMSRLSGMKRRT